MRFIKERNLDLLDKAVDILRHSNTPRRDNM